MVVKHIFLNFKMNEEDEQELRRLSTNDIGTPSPEHGGGFEQYALFRRCCEGGASIPLIYRYGGFAISEEQRY